jgi:5'-methylthioadenosine nucleosidase
MIIRHLQFLFHLAVFAFLPICACSSDASAPHPYKKILIVIAMDSEANPIIQQLGLKPLAHHFSNLPMNGYVGHRHESDILLIKNGEDPINKVQNIGKEAATLSTYLGIEYFHPDLIISIGTAGSVPENGAKLMDIYLSRTTYFFDRRIPMKGYDEYGRGGYPSLALSSISKKLQLKEGIICSGDSFDEAQIDYNVFLKEHCSAIDMEAAAVAWVSMLTHTPMIAIKGITNFVRGKEIHAQYERNLPEVTQQLAIKLDKLIGFM